MKNVLIGLALGILAAGTAYAIESQRDASDTDGDAVLTRVEAQAVADQVFGRLAHAPLVRHPLAHPENIKPLAPAR